MLYLKNEFLTLRVSEKGAEMTSLKDCNGFEYLWQGDKKYWSGQAPVLFPFIGRLFESKYTYASQTYKMTKHGFLRNSTFKPEKISDSEAVFIYESNEETKVAYPFDFKFSLRFKLVEKAVLVEALVENIDAEGKTMFFAYGGHPAFNLPFEEGLAFEDYKLSFETTQNAKKELLGPNFLMADAREVFEFDTENTLNLKHNLFDNDAIILKDAGERLKLYSDKGKKALYFDYKDMDYIALWHAAQTDAPFICLEPWTALPGREDTLEALESIPNFNRLEYGKKSCISYAIRLEF